MTKKLQGKKRKPKYSWPQIKQVVEDIYAVESQRDSWGVPVVYEKTFLRYMKFRLKRIKEFIK